MRLFSYNILDGGEGRADPLAEVIEAQRADVVCLVEADNLVVVERIAARLKMDFIHAPGRKSAAALLSRWPIRGTVNHALLKPGIEKSFLEAEVVEPGGRVWPIGVVHLHAGAYDADEQIREQELAIVLERFASHRSGKQAHLLAGDFNANAPYQRIDPDRCRKKTRDAWRATGGHFPRRVVGTILNTGYVDTLRTIDRTGSETTGSFTTQQPGQRFDYIFAYGLRDLTIRHAWVEHDRLARYASDHFPVGVEIE